MLFFLRRCLEHGEFIGQPLQVNIILRPHQFVNIYICCLTERHRLWRRRIRRCCRRHGGGFWSHWWGRCRCDGQASRCCFQFSTRTSQLSLPSWWPSAAKWLAEMSPPFRKIYFNRESSGFNIIWYLYWFLIWSIAYIQVSLNPVNHVVCTALLDF